MTLNSLQKFGRRCWGGQPRLVCLLVATVSIFITVTTTKAFEASSPGNPIQSLRLGVAAHDVDGLWGGDSKEDGVDLYAEIAFNHPLFRLLSATAYPNAGVALNTRGHTHKLFGGFKLAWEPLPDFLLSTGLGLTAHTGRCDTNDPDRKSMGSPVLFRIPIELGWRFAPRYCLWLAFDHISNAYLFWPNEGMDTLGLMVEYRF